MREISLDEPDSASCYSGTTIRDKDNFNLNTFNNYLNARTQLEQEGELRDDYNINIIINNETISIKLSHVGNFIQMIVSAQELQETMGIKNMFLPLITVQHLIIYIFCNLGEYFLQHVGYINQIQLLHLGKKYTIEDFTYNKKMSLVDHLKIDECPTLHLVLTAMPSNPLPLISEKFMVMNFFSHEETSGSVTYAEAIAKKFKSNKDSRKSSIVSNPETLQGDSLEMNKTSLKTEGKFRKAFKKLRRNRPQANLS